MKKIKPGDRVEVKVVGKVTEVNGPYIITDNDIHISLETPGINVRKVAPPKPEVGDVIDGERMKATPWRAGSVFLSEPGSVPVMLAQAGHFVEPAEPGFAFDFNDIDDWDEFKVVHLP